MWRRFLAFLTCLVFVSGLTACGGGGGSSSGKASGGIIGGSDDDGGEEDNGGNDGDDFVTNFRKLDDPEAEAVFASLEDARTSSFTNSVFAQGNEASFASVVDPNNVPASDKLDYTGHLFLIVSNRATGVGASVTGDANLSINVTARSISGAATGFLGRRDDGNGEQIVVDYQGNILISQGSMTDSGGTATVQFDVNGTLDDAVNTFVIDNTLTGILYGDGGTGLSAGHTRVATDMNSTVNGNPADFDQATLQAIRNP